MTSTRKVSISQVTTARWGFVESVEAYAREGVEGVGVWPDKLAEVGVEKAARLIRDAGLGVSSLVFVANFTLDVGAGVEQGRRVIDEAHKLGAQTILVAAGPRLNVSTGEANRRTRAGLEALGPLAKQAGITLGLEPMHPIYTTYFSTITTIDQALEVMGDLPGTGLMYDTWNTWWDPQVEAAIQRAGPRIACAQIADMRHPADDPRDRTPPGEGVAPLAQLVACLERAGYSGWYEVELFTNMYEPAQYPELVRSCLRGTRNVLAAARP